MKNVPKLNWALSAIVFLLGVNLVFNACKKEDQVKLSPPMSVLEAFASKKFILSLPLEDQKHLWIKRLEMYNEIGLTTEQLEVVNDLVTDIKNLEKGKFFLSDAIKQDAIALARMMPREDFINLFTMDIPARTLPTLRKTGKICIECITDIEKHTSAVAVSGDAVSDRIQVNPPPDCDCNWTCGDPDSDCPDGAGSLLSECTSSSSTNCCAASGGCGFLWLGTCNGLVVCE
jgi:hypothetical protein